MKAGKQTEFLAATFGMKTLRLFAIIYQRRFWIAIFIVLYLLPVWVFRFFPSQDGPSHLYNAQILREFSNPNYDFRQYYQLNLALFPNWLANMLEWAFLYVAPALIAEKLLLTVYVIAFPLSFFYLLDAVQPGRNLVGFISFLFIFNFLLMKGLFSFALAIPLFFLTLGYWWRHKERLGWKEIALCNLLMALIFLGHLVPYLLAAFSLGVLALVYFRRRIRLILLTAACILPSSILPIQYLLTSSSIGSKLTSVQFTSVPSLFQQLISLGFLVSFNKNQQILAQITAVILGALLLFSLWKDVQDRRKLTAQPFSPRFYFLLLALLLLIIYLFAPKAIGSGTMLNERIGLLAVLLMAVFFREGEKPVWRWLAVGLGAVLLVNLAWLGYTFHTLNKSLNAFVSAVPQIEANKVILPILIGRNGPSLKVGIYEHADNYYTLDNGGINVMNYETEYDYFPVKFKANFQPPLNTPLWVEAIFSHPERVDLCGYASHIDYLLIFDIQGKFEPDSLARCYDTIYNKNGLRLYKPK
jgi:hypothetical protein